MLYATEIQFDMCNRDHGRKSEILGTMSIEVFHYLRDTICTYYLMLEDQGNQKIRTTLFLL